MSCVYLPARNTDVGVSQEVLDSLTAEVLREFASEPRLEVDPAQNTATFAQLLHASVGIKTLATIVYFANRIGWHTVDAGRRKWAPYARKSGIAGRVFRFALGSADRVRGLPGVTETIVRDTFVGAVIISLAYMTVMSQLGDTAAAEVIQTITYMSNAHSNEAADEFADKVNLAKTIVCRRTKALCSADTAACVGRRPSSTVRLSQYLLNGPLSPVYVFAFNRSLASCTSLRRF
eukprot:COSAG02_NODE_11044_length_1805_cov_23.563306_2_plen_234_part_00